MCHFDRDVPFLVAIAVGRKVIADDGDGIGATRFAIDDADFLFREVGRSSRA